jgi:hypothetical protein
MKGMRGATMELELTAEQNEARAAFRAFVDDEVAPDAGRYDEEERLPATLIGRFAERGYLGAALPAAFGGGGMDPVTYGLLHEEVGRGSASAQGLLNVHNMAAQPICRWGTEEQRAVWLPRLASGRTLAAFAVTEPNVGSDAKSVETVAVAAGDEWVLDGHKRWITCAQVADVFVLLARCEDRPTAFLVERDRPGLAIEPITGLLGCRGWMLGTLELRECRIPRANLLGRVGFGFSHVVAGGLDAGRQSLAWGCVGLAQACLEACLRYTTERKQFGVLLRDHQLIQRMITRMITNVRAARLLCHHAARRRAAGDPSAVMDAAIAKYFASTVSNEIASDAVQIHGANGCHRAYGVERFLRDAKIMEIVEGTSQIQETLIARLGYQAYAAAIARPAANALGADRQAQAG